MCRYISLVLPKTARPDRVQQLLQKHGFGYQPYMNEFVAGQLWADAQLLRPTIQQCDCDAVVGCDAHSTGWDDLARKREQLKRKGWSETKITNWMTSKARSARSRHDEAERLQWLQLLQELTAESRIGKVGLYFHWYENDLQTEPIVFSYRKQLSVAALPETALASLVYDVLYEFVP